MCALVFFVHGTAVVPVLQELEIMARHPVSRASSAPARKHSSREGTKRLTRSAMVRIGSRLTAKQHAALLVEAQAVVKRSLAHQAGRAAIDGRRAPGFDWCAFFFKQTPDRRRRCKMCHRDVRLRSMPWVAMAAHLGACPRIHDYLSKSWCVPITTGTASSHSAVVCIFKSEGIWLKLAPIGGGYGVFAVLDIPAHTRVAMYAGTLMTKADKERAYPTALPVYVLQLSANKFVDGTRAQSFSRFVNRGGNGFPPNNCKLRSSGAMFTRRRVRAGEQLLVPYGPAHKI